MCSRASSGLIGTLRSYLCIICIIQDPTGSGGVFNLTFQPPRSSYASYIIEPLLGPLGVAVIATFGMVDEVLLSVD
ncbi:hypothetical protein F5Y15DRAFT_372157 [Xylariaceae sp. FL0016]|nr:hypothetical protein F5Y15DRAFT_372157 [Xylariaceae sp. FL0016]